MSDDELIAEFMGFKKNIFEPEFYVIPRPFSDYGGPFCSREFISFRKWDWLMPVVEKITPIALQIGQQAWSDIKYDLLDGSIDRVYRRVVEFIKWHNQNKL